MAWQWVATAALMSACVTLAVWLRNLPQETPPIAVEPTRQFSDAIDSQAAVQIVPEPLPELPGQFSPQTQSGPDLPALYDTDIAYLRSSFGLADLESLAINGRAVLELPGHAPIELTLEDREIRHGIEQMSVSHAGMISTISRRGELFFATLATRTESYRMESDGSGSRLYPHRQLAARTIRHEKDFRHVH